MCAEIKPGNHCNDQHNETAKENKRDKINEKRRKLEAKVDEAYAKFSEKVDEEKPQV